MAHTNNSVAARKAARAIATRSDMLFDSWTLAPASRTFESSHAVASTIIDRTALNGQTLRTWLASQRAWVNPTSRPALVVTELDDGARLALDLVFWRTGR